MARDAIADLSSGVACADAPAGAKADPAPLLGLGPTVWPGFQAGPAHNLLFGTAGGAASMQVRWTFRAHGEIDTAPTVVNGVLYVGALDHCLYALNARSGGELWAFKADNMIMSEPVVVNGRVFFGTGNKVMRRTAGALVRGTGPSAVYALSARTGRELWMFPTGGEVMSTPAYAHGVLYVATGDSAFYALDAATGHVLWKLRGLSIDSMSSPAIYGNVAVFGGARPYAFYGINLASRRTAWKLKATDAEGGVDDGSPAIDATGRAFVQVPEGVYPQATVVEWAIGATTGQNPWQRVLGTGTIPVANKEEVGSATVVQNVVYVGTPAVPGLWALDAATGSPLWPAPTPLPRGIRTPPTVTATDIYAISGGELFVVDRTTGRLLRVVRIGSPGPQECAPAGLTVVGDTLYAAGGYHAHTLMAIPLQAV